MEKKLTKKDLFARMIDILKETEADDKDTLIDFAQKEIDALGAKAEKAKSYKRKKKEDTLKEVVYTKLDKIEFRTIADILTDIDDSEVSAAMITARLTALVKEGLVEKQDIKTEDKRTVKGYKLVTA